MLQKSKSECVGALRSYADYCKQADTSFSYEGYEAWHKDHKDRPSGRTIIKALGGSWNEARLVVTKNPHDVNPYRPPWDYQECLTALRTFERFCKENNRVPSTRGFTRWAEELQLTDIPSAATISRTLGNGSWYQARRAASENPDEIKPLPHGRPRQNI